MKKTVYIIDAYNLIYRMFYAVPEFRTAHGIAVNAVFGVVRSLLDIYNHDCPDKLIFACDGPGKTFREEIFEEYKGTRDRMPDELRDQTGFIFEFLELAGIPAVVVPGFEADDLIGTFATHLPKDGYQVTIISADKDLHQFVNDDVHIYDPMKRRLYTREKTIEKFGIAPEYILDYLSLVGDSSDNIPGVAGIGPKGAEKLIKQYGHLKDIYDHINEITGRTQTLLIEGKERAFLSHKLAEIDTNVETNFDINIADFCDLDMYSDAIIEFFERLEFRSLIPADKQKDRSCKAEINNIDIKTQDELKELQTTLKDTKKITLTLTGGKEIEYCIISTKPGVTYSVAVQAFDCADFLEQLFESDIEIIGYKLKDDLKKIHEYKNQKIADIFQGSLF